VKLRQIIPLGLSAILLASCGGMLVPVTDVPTVTEGDPVFLSSPEPTPTQPTPIPPVHTLTVCAGSEPSELFLYNDKTYIKQVILSAIYDGPLDGVNFDTRPVILQKMPSLIDGDAVIEAVAVNEGDLVMDASGALTVLQAGTLVHPLGCSSPDCAIRYETGTLQMDHMRVIFHIRPGVEWADGASLTAADSVFS
jgi:peptide/nickel transport system substrate-binding protein